MTPADYDPYCVTAPVDSRLPGSVSGKQFCGLYDINPAKFGQVNKLRDAGIALREDESRSSTASMSTSARGSGRADSSREAWPPGAR